MTLQNKNMGGFRELDAKEIEAVSGGFGEVDDNIIIVNGVPPEPIDFGVDFAFGLPAGYVGDYAYDLGEGGAPPEDPYACLNHTDPTNDDTSDDNSNDASANAAVAEAGEIGSILGQIPGVINLAVTEYQSIIYTDANGELQSLGPFEGQSVGVLGNLFVFPELQAAMDDIGITQSDVIGFVHNHPGGTLEFETNRYPSPTDWLNAEGRIAQGADPATLTLYVVDAKGDVRSFSYADKASYENLSDAEKRAGVNLPEEIQQQDSCGG